MTMCYDCLHMNEIYITGHRNPDIDTVCSAYAYAQLKKIIDPSRQYIPIRCGHLSESVEKQLALIGFEPQPYKRDVRPKGLTPSCRNRASR